MKLVLILVFSLLVQNLWAQEQKPLSKQECYQRFLAYPPQKVVEEARKRVKLVQEQGKKSFPLFNTVNKTSWINPPYGPLFVVERCDEMRAETMFFPQLYPVVTKPGYLKLFKDAQGQSTFALLCLELETHPEGRWKDQQHFWTGCQGPLQVNVLVLPVPGTPWLVQSSFLSEDYSTETLNQLLQAAKAGP